MLTFIVVNAMNNSPSRIARFLLEAGVVSIQPDAPFTFSSGIRSPIYLNNMTLMSNPSQRSEILKYLELTVSQQFPTVQAIATTIGGSVPWATQLSDRLNLPMVYTRKQRKRYAYKNEIEGILQPGRSVLLVESAIGSGSTIKATAEKIRRCGGQIVGLVAIFDYQLATSSLKFRQMGLRMHTLTNLDTLLDIGGRRGIISQENEKIVRSWQAQPIGWYSRHQTMVAP